METNFHEKNKSRWGTKLVIFLLAVSSLAMWLIISYGVHYVLTQCPTCLKTEQTETTTNNDENIEELYTIPTVEETIEDWRNAVKEDSLYGLYLQLPEVIFKQIVDRIGTNASPTEIALEYIRNKAYYISLQLSKQLKPTITGPDADNIEKVEIKTTMKAPKEKRITTAPSDTLK